MELFRDRGYHNRGKLDTEHETMRHVRGVTRLPARADEIVVDPPDLTRFEKVQAVLDTISAVEPMICLKSGGSPYTCGNL